MGEVVSRGGVSNLSTMQDSDDSANASAGGGERGDQTRLMMVAACLYCILSLNCLNIFMVHNFTWGDAGTV